MKMHRSLLDQIVKPAHIIALCIACLFSPVLLSAQTATIPLDSLPRNSRLAIWGDSITEVTLYPRYVEMYLLACAGRKDIKVCTFGHSGETLAGLLNRQSDLEAFHPTIVTFLYGMNDTQYSVYTEARGASFDTTMHAALAMLKSNGVRQRIVAGPTLVDDTYKSIDFFKGADPHGLTAAQSQNATLGHFRDFGRAAAIETGSAFADVHNRMIESYTLAKNGLGPQYDFGMVHPAANGHLMIAYELLKTLACSGDIGTIDVAMKGEAHASAGHSVVSFSNGAIVLDSSQYPFCYHYDPFNDKAANSLVSILPYLPFSQDLNRLVLKVSHLDAPSAKVTWGSETRLFTRDQLMKGVNLPEEFSHTPFDTPFARGMQAIADKQEFENYMIKGTSNYNGNDNGGNFDANMIAIHDQKDAAVKAVLIPVRHTIVIVPIGTPDTVAPVITGTMMAYATVGQAFTYQPSALHAPTGFSANGLPKGLAINAATGEITGVPTERGISSIAFKATNGNGSGMATLTLSVTTPLPDRPVITSPDAASGSVSMPFAYQITANNKPTHYFATSPGAKGIVPPESSLPAGLTYNTATGLVSGAPSAAGTYLIQVAAMNESGVVAKLITLTVKDR